MNILICVIPLCALIISQVCCQDIFSTELQRCNIDDDVVHNYRNDIYEFSAQLFKNIGSILSTKNFVLYPLSGWVILAALAEGLDPATKQTMFRFLNFPSDPCTRLKYYQLATSRFVSSDDINVTSKRVMVIDEGVTMNPTYHSFLFKNSLLDVVSAPMQSDPRAALEEMRRISSGQLTNLDLSGNSILLDSVDYNGLWSTAFENAVIERSPFYSSTGEHIGAVDLMRVTRRARVAHFKPLNMKCLELPVGYNNRYRMIFAIVLDRSANRAISLVTGSIVSDFLKSLTYSYELIDIAIPRATVTSEYDIKTILENVGIQDLWRDPTITEYMSSPAALPSGFVQRSSFSIDTAGVEPAPFSNQHCYNFTSDTDPFSKDFIANKPFFMALFDSETYTSILAVSFRTPTYPNS